MRHSYATYLYEKTNDANLVAKELGHRQGINVFLDHYRGLATKTDAEGLFADVLLVLTDA